MRSSAGGRKGVVSCRGTSQVPKSGYQAVQRRRGVVHPCAPAPRFTSICPCPLNPTTLAYPTFTSNMCTFLHPQVEEVFAAGDLPRVADMLSSMRRSLSLVGDVPEFRAGRQKLHQLEDRLQGLIEGSLADALAASTPRAGAAGAAAGSGATDETVRQLAGLLLAVDRLSTIDNLYCSSRCAAVAAKWDELSAAAAAAAAAAPGTLAGLAWLPHFLAWLTAFLEEQAAWCGRVLPAHQPQLMAGLCRAALRRMSGGIKEALAAAPVAAQLKGPGAMAALVGLQRELAAVATAVAELVKGSEVQVSVKNVRMEG